ncbi:polymer-forming cytoskeletal protein [Actinocorallia longicatena]|uniref:Polymer-forming cytoskeletal protein n=1 Tax=Actinocorallia longicatena TaxID=111803 RepID=A0ABP6Q8T3_9ACTN
MPTSYLAWNDAVTLFEARGVPESTYRNLYEEDYILVSGPAAVSGELPMDDHERTPWAAGDTPDGATGYIVDGDLSVDGDLVDIDDGAAALIVLGDLRARNVYLEGDIKLIVMGDVTADAFVGDMTDKLVMIHGDLRATVAIFWNEFCPDLIGGTLQGRALTPGYLDLSDAPIGRVVDPAPAAPLADLLVPELLVTADPGERDFTEIGVRGATLRERVIDGQPLIRV